MRVILLSIFNLEVYLELPSLFFFPGGLFDSEQTWKRTSVHWSIPGVPHKPALQSQLVVSTKLIYNTTWSE